MKKSTLLLAFTAASAILMAHSAFAHAVLKESSPAAGAMLASQPGEIRLRFNEALEAPFSKVTLLDRQGHAVNKATATVAPEQPDTMLLVLPALPSGSYQVQWSTMTHDGHRTKGQFGFQVK
jgi:methionine-rich copper-binding protein CopC